MGYPRVNWPVTLNYDILVITAGKLSDYPRVSTQETAGKHPETTGKRPESAGKGSGSIHVNRG